MVLKQSTNNLINGDVIPGRYGPLQSARRRFCFFAKFQNLTTNFFAAVLSILPLYEHSVSLVSTQISEPCYESSRATDTFIIVCRRGLGLGQIFPNFLWRCTPSAFRYMNIYP